MLEGLSHAGVRVAVSLVRYTIQNIKHNYTYTGTLNYINNTVIYVYWHFSLKYNPKLKAKIFWLLESKAVVFV